MDHTREACTNAGIFTKLHIESWYLQNSTRYHQGHEKVKVLVKLHSVNRYYWNNQRKEKNHKT